MKQKIKSFLLSFISLRMYFAFAERKQQKQNQQFPQLNQYYFFKLLAKEIRPLFFVQIGANDGQKNDPINSWIKKYNWEGILVEPLPDFFRRLKENYKAQKGLIFENVGIGDTEGDLNFYYMPAEYNEPDWLQQIGTFDRHAIELNLAGFPSLIPKIAIDKKPLIKLKTLLQRNNVKKIDLMIIDAEGFEYSILSQLDEYPVKPSFIFFEWGCLEKEVLEKLLRFLETHNYRFYTCGSDILAVKNN